MNRETHWREMTSHGWEFEHPKSAHFGLGTGMLDQNGVEIYEGDVLTSDFPRGKPVRMAVCFGRWTQPNVDGDMLGFFVSFIPETENRYWRQDIIFWADRSRVIGNVHENPELTEEVADDGE